MKSRFRPLKTQTNLHNHRKIFLCKTFIILCNRQWAIFFMSETLGRFYEILFHLNGSLLISHALLVTTPQFPTLSIYLIQNTTFTNFCCNFALVVSHHSLKYSSSMLICPYKTNRLISRTFILFLSTLHLVSFTSMVTFHLFKWQFCLFWT